MKSDLEQEFGLEVKHERKRYSGKFVRLMIWSERWKEVPKFESLKVREK